MRKIANFLHYNLAPIHWDILEDYYQYTPVAWLKCHDEEKIFLKELLQLELLEKNEDDFYRLTPKARQLIKAFLEII